MDLVTLETSKNRAAWNVINDIGRQQLAPDPDPLTDLIYSFVNSRIVTAETTLFHIYANCVGLVYKIGFFFKRILACITTYFGKGKKSQ